MSGSEPEISVVLGVYNEAGSILETLQSLDQQRGVVIEVIAVNDGSTDGTGALLDRYATSRTNYRVIHQANTGLTSALIAGCASASGDLIARQDAGDRSAPDRLKKQRDLLIGDNGISLVSCGARFHDMDGQLLYENVPVDLPQLMPPHHGSALFRRRDYERVGGYRGECYVAQDMDLWLRLGELGRHGSLPECLYHAVISPGSISIGRRQIQEVVADHLQRASALRREGHSDQTVMDEVAIMSRAQSATSDQRLCDYHYFCGSCLATRNPEAARHHFLAAWRAKPLHWRSFARLLGTFLHRPPGAN